MWFKKKKVDNNPPSQPPPTACHHKYIDFGWYVSRITDSYHGDYSVEVREPYVCVLCHHREDRVLNRWVYGSEKERDKTAERLLKDARIHDALEIEDKIADMQMLDPYYLDAYYKLYPERKVNNDA